MTFTVDEINLMCIFDTKNKNKLIDDLKRAIPFVDNTELKEITEGIISKLAAMTDDEFAELEIIPTVSLNDVEGNNE